MSWAGPSPRRAGRGAPRGAELEITRLAKSYDAQMVLAGVDLLVRDQSFTAILGPSGSGKTTMLRLVAGFDRPDAGEIRLGGRPVDGDGHHVPPEHRRVGYVPQEGGLFPHLTVDANIRFGLRRAERRRRLDDLIDLVGLGEVIHRYPHQLSGGQQQRVALARALAIRPALVLMDEPFSSLDASLRASVRDDVRRVLTEAGTTAVLVTHDQDEALSLADQVAVLRAGRIVQHGSPADLYTRPVDAELARFVGEANLCRGTVRGNEVLTSLGSLPLASGMSDALRGATEVVVLVRPEQVVVARAPGRIGELPGRVRQVDFHGHDAVVSVAVTGADGKVATLEARLAGPVRVAAGADVVLSVSGAVMAWPVAEVPASELPASEVPASKAGRRGWV